MGVITIIAKVFYVAVTIGLLWNAKNVLNNK